MKNGYWALLLSLLLCGEVGATTIYKWVDKHGVVHYSGQPPVDGQTAKSVDSSKIEPKPIGFDAPRPAPKMTTEPTDEQINATLIRNQNVEQADAICEQAKQNADILSNFHKVTKTDPTTNETVIMTDDERETALADSRKQITLFCKDK